MDQTTTPELDRSNCVSSAEVLPLSSLEPLINHLRDLAQSTPFDLYIQNQLRKNRFSFPLPPDDQPTKIAPITDGFAVGLKSGRVLLIQPPAAMLIDPLQVPIAALDGLSTSSLILAVGTEVVSWSLLESQVEHREDCGRAVRVTLCNVKKDLIVAGCEDGAIVLFKVENYQPCSFALVAVLPLLSAPDLSPVIDMKTTDETTWLAAIFLSKCIALWDHETCSLLYSFSFQNTTVLPTIYPQGQRIILPLNVFCESSLLDKWHQTWNKQWTVTSNFILLHSRLIIRLSGNVVSKIYRLVHHYEKDDEKWETYAAASKRGFFVFDSGNCLVALTPLGGKKTQEVMKKWPLIEVDLGLDYEDCCLSMLGSYIGLVGKTSVEVVTVVGMEAQFKHSLTGGTRYRNSGECVFWRFLQLVNEKGDCVLGKQDPALIFPTTSKYISYVLFRCRDKKNSVVLARLSDGYCLTIKTETPAILHAFSKDNSTLLLVQKTAAQLWNLQTMELKCEIPGSFSDLSRPRFTSNGTLFIFNPAEVVIISPQATILRQPWNLEKVTRLPDDSFLAFSKTKACHYLWSESVLTLQTESRPGFDQLRVFNSGQMCAGLGASGISILSLPTLTYLIQLPSTSMLLVDRASDLFATYEFDASSADFDMLSLWNLKVGVPIWRVDMGLRDYLRKPPEGPAASFFPGWTKFRVNYQKPTSLQLFNTWKFNISSLVVSNALSVPDIAKTTVFEEKLDRHCVVMKRFSDLALTGKYDSVLALKLLLPFHVNVLHILVYRNQSAVLAQALKDGAAVVQSYYGTPLSLCIERNARKCLDCLLQALIDLNGSSGTGLLTALYHIKDDFQPLLRFGSVVLPGFLRILMRPKPEEILASSTLSNGVSLPCSVVSDSLWIAKFSKSRLSLPSASHEAVEFLICPIPVHAELGSAASLSFLKVLVFDVSVMEVLNNDYIKTVVDMKWNKLWPVVLFVTVCYWTYLILMLLRIFRYTESDKLDAAFLAFNTLFLLQAICQFVTSFRQFRHNFGVYSDLVRSGFAYAWVLSSEKTWLTFITVLLCLIRGLTTFQTFAPTRFFVRMIYTVCLKTISFIFILIYSTLSFGLLFAIADPAAIPTFTQSWSVSAQLDMGGFDMDEAGGLVWAVFLAASLVNVVWLLNLLISILGDAYAEFQPEAAGADVMAKAGFVYQFEGMMAWRRVLQRAPVFVQTCTRESSQLRLVSTETRLAQLSAQINALEARLISKEGFEDFQQTVESRLLELKSLFKSSPAANALSRLESLNSPEKLKA